MDQELLGKLLIASPGLEDIRFQDSVILICEHSKDATMGLILNKPLYNFDTSQFLKKMKINSETNIKPSPTFFGGPVHLNQGFIIHSNEKKYKTSENILDTIEKYSLITLTIIFRILKQTFLGIEVASQFGELNSREK